MIQILFQLYFIIINFTNNLYHINNLQLYCKLLNNDNCKLFISEWSGGGQLAQYCYNGKIMYYFSSYNPLDYVINNKNHEARSISNNYFQNWDFKSTTKCIREYYNNINDLVHNINF